MRVGGWEPQELENTHPILAGEAWSLTPSFLHWLWGGWEKRAHLSRQVALEAPQLGFCRQDHEFLISDLGPSSLLFRNIVPGG